MDQVLAHPCDPVGRRLRDRAVGSDVGRLELVAGRGVGPEGDRDLESGPIRVLEGDRGERGPQALRGDLEKRADAGIQVVTGGQGRGRPGEDVGDGIHARAVLRGGSLRLHPTPRRGPRAHLSTPILRPMKLVVAIVHNEDAGTLVDALLEHEHRATRLHSSGGFLKQSNATILVGIEDDRVDEILGIVARELHGPDPDRQPDAADHGAG